jgi:hypothetical protein
VAWLSATPETTEYHRHGAEIARHKFARSAVLVDEMPEQAQHAVAAEPPAVQEPVAEGRPFSESPGSGDAALAVRVALLELPRPFPLRDALRIFSIALLSLWLWALIVWAVSAVL